MNVDIELQFKQRNTYNTTFYFLLGFVQYTPHKVFNSFVQCVVDARRAGDENSLSGVVTETMKLL